MSAVNGMGVSDLADEVGAEDVAVAGVKKLRVGEPRRGEGEGVVGLAGVGGRAGDEELGGVHEHADAVELDVGERFAVGGVARGFDAAFGDAGDDCGLLPVARSMASMVFRDAGATDKGDLCSVGRPGGPELIGFCGGDLLECAGGDVDGPDIVAAFEGAIGGKGDGGAVGGDAGFAVVAVANGDLLQAGAVGCMVQMWKVPPA